MQYRLPLCGKPERGRQCTVPSKRRRGGPPNKRRGIGVYLLYRLRLACAEKSSPIMFFDSAAHAKGSSVPAGRLRRPTALRRVLRFCKTDVRAHRAHPQNRGQPSRLPPIFNLRFGVSFFERSVYLEIGNTHRAAAAVCRRLRRGGNGRLLCQTEGYIQSLVDLLHRAVVQMAHFLDRKSVV